MNTLNRFLKDEKGLESVEWAVLATLIVIGVIAVIDQLGTNVLSTFTKLESATAPKP
ncbi:MAG: Flp family type IVb pilin [Planctomycetota bacterium]|jgi:Flp pilus assembly pilin Flp